MFLVIMVQKDLGKKVCYNTVCMGVNESQKRSPHMWKKWREAGSVATTPEIERKRLLADLKIVDPEPIHNHYKIGFSSEGRDDNWRVAYSQVIIEIAKENGWQPFFQLGHFVRKDNEMKMPVDTYHEIEMWNDKEGPEAMKAAFEGIHEKALEKYKILQELHGKK